MREGVTVEVVEIKIEGGQEAEIDTGLEIVIEEAQGTIEKEGLDPLIEEIREENQDLDQTPEEEEDAEKFRFFSYEYNFMIFDIFILQLNY